MKRKLFVILMLALLAFAVFIGVTACKKPPEALQSPLDLTVEKRILTWDAVENASGYVVRVDNNTYETEECRLALYGIAMDGGDYRVEVMARGDQVTYADSAWTQTVITLSKAPAQGYDEKGFQYTLLADKSGYEISKGKVSLRGDLVLPDYYCDIPVTRIANCGFTLKEHDDVSLLTTLNHVTTSIKFPAHLESIGGTSFPGLFLIEELALPDGVREIEDFAFYNALNVKRIVLPKSIKIIGDHAFGNAGLKELTLPEGLETIGKLAFACDLVDGNTTHPQVSSNLESVVFPSSVTSIGPRAFEGQLKLGTIQFSGNDLQYLGKNAFKSTLWYQSQADSDVIFLDGLDGVLYEDRRPVSEEFTIPADTKVIAGNAYPGIMRSGVKKVVIPAGVKIITTAVFDLCETLCEIVLSEGLESIPDQTFSYTAIEKVVIPNSVRHIGRSAFASCVNLKEVIFPASLETIGARAFAGSLLTEVVLPEGVREIGENAFSQCSQLEKVVIPSSLQTLGGFPFTSTAGVTVFYGNTTESWEAMRLPLEEAIKQKFDPSGADMRIQALRELFTTVKIYYYSEEQPTSRGSYWHYVDGVATPWW